MIAAFYGNDNSYAFRYRREGARLILDIGNKMGLRFDTIWTGVIYFHRFYMFRSFKDFKRYVTATCCLFLGKPQFILQFTYMYYTCTIDLSFLEMKNENDFFYNCMPSWKSGRNPEEM